MPKSLRMMHAVRQVFPRLEYRVVPVPWEQGEAMQERHEPHVYKTSRQAYSVCERLEEERTGNKVDSEDVKMQLVIEGTFPRARAKEALEVLESLGWAVDYGKSDNADELLEMEGEA